MANSSADAKQFRASIAAEVARKPARFQPSKPTVSRLRQDVPLGMVRQPDVPVLREKPGTWRGDGAECDGVTDLSTIRCACGSADVVAIDPGEPIVISEATDIMASRGRPVTGRCLACWPMLRGFQQELFAVVEGQKRARAA